jgi:hypothetical protein
MRLKRIIAAAVSAGMLLPSCLAAYAADPFPVAEYESEGRSIYIGDKADMELSDFSARAKAGYVAATYLEYEGTVHGETAIKQTAHLKLRLPEGYKDFLAENDIDKGYGFSCGEEKSYSKDIYYEDRDTTVYNNYVWNTVTQSLKYNISTSYFKKMSGSMDEELEKLKKGFDSTVAAHWGENWMNDNPAGIEPVIVERGEDGSAYIAYHHQEYEKRDISAEVKGHGMVNGFAEIVRDNMEYFCLNVIPGTPYYCYTEVWMQGATNAFIYEPSDTEYVPTFEAFKQKEKEFVALDFGRQLALNKDLIELEWLDPEIFAIDSETEADRPTEPSEAQTMEVEHTQAAIKDAGEDSGVLIPALIVVGVIAVGGAGAAIALKKSKDSERDDKDNKNYKMFINKSFGDTIPRGSKNVKVGARIAQVDSSGNALDRDDLTAKITAGGKGMIVNSLLMNGRYMEATLEVPKDLLGNTASVTFRYTGKGGSFSNTVEFKVSDGVTLKFTNEPSKDGLFTPQGSEYEIEAISGDGFTYEAYFMLTDAVEPAKLSDISAGRTDGFDVSFEETGYQNVFKVLLKNNTAPAEDDIFAEPVKKGIDINVNIKDQDKPAAGYIGVTLYKEGLSISSRQAGKKNDIKYVGVQAYEKSYVGDLDNNWQVSEISFVLAVKGDGRAEIDPAGAEYTFEKLKGAGGMGSSASAEESLAKKYEYKEETGELGGRFTYTFEPNATLCEPEDGTFFMVMLPVSCTQAGKNYKADIPLRLMGKIPDPYEGWDEEYKKLKERIEKYSLPEDRQKWEERLDELVLDPKCSTAQLRLTSKLIVRNYMRYWLVESVDARNEAELYDGIITQLEWLKFFGDCAFSILVTLYAGPVAEAIISPAKDFATQAIGELFAALNHGEKIDASIVERFEFAKNLSAAGDNLVANNIKLTNWKQAAATLGAYLVYSSIKNYIKKLNDSGESDLYGALVNGFTDMTTQAFKAYASKMFEMWMKNSKTFQKKIGPWITKYFKETNFNNLQMQYNNWQQLSGDIALKDAAVVTMELTEVLNKYLTELVGLLAAKAQEIVDENTKTSSGFAIAENGSITFSFTMQAFRSRNYLVVLNLNSILTNLSCPLFGWLYDMIFAQVPVAASVVQPPKDPPLPPEKK